MADDERLQAWSALVAVYQSVLHDVVRGLEGEAGLDSGVFSALAYLARAEPEGRLRLSDLHELMHPRYSQPGLSRLVQRMEVDGLVERLADPADGRATILVMTRAGRARFTRANAVYAAALREHFGRHLSRAEARALQAALEPIAPRTRDRGCSVEYRSRAMIKYIGSKRRLVPVLGELASAIGARTALDLFTGTTRVAQELKRRRMVVTAVDSARYAEIFARCYVATDAGTVDARGLDDALRDLAGRPGIDGYFTETFCEQSRFFQPANGRRVDAIRDAIEADYAGSALYPILLTSLIEAADRVDSTTGVQMAYVKQWAPRSFRPLELRVPGLLPGGGTAVRGDACEVARGLGRFDLAYLDPPYNQHRYFTNYHIWETLVAWDAPPYYGVACKRVDARDPQTRSVFNERRRMAEALAQVIRDVDADVIAVSYNDESWVTIDELEAMIAARGDAVRTLAFDSRRYVGALIGIHNPKGEKVGTVQRLRNVEYVVVGGDGARVARLASVADEFGGTSRPEGNGSDGRQGNAWRSAATSRS